MTATAIVSALPAPENRFSMRKHHAHLSDGDVAEGEVVAVTVEKAGGAETPALPPVGRFRSRLMKDTLL